MNDSGFKTDLFEDHPHEKPGPKKRIFGGYFKRRILTYLRIPAEHAVIAGILVLLLLLVSYVSGVESGKRLSYSGRLVPTEDRDATLTTKEAVRGDLGEGVPSISDKEKSPGKTDTVSSYKAPSSIEEPLHIMEAIKPPKVGFSTNGEAAGAMYVIQLVSFQREKYARDEISKLERSGKNVSMVKKGDWYQICAKGYKNIADARKDRGAFAADYPDCYIRKLEKSE